MKYETLKVVKKENILSVTLNRPEKRNALNAQMVAELTTVFDPGEFKRCSGVIITGEGSSFCAGADLQYLKSIRDYSYEQHLEDSKNLLNMYQTIYNYPAPVVALANGPAIGGGCGLTGICDYVIAAESAKFGYPEVKIGFTPAIVSVFLVYSIGYRKAKELLLSGKILSAGEAYDFGLVNRVVPDNDLNRIGTDYLNQIKQNSPVSVTLTKRFINHINEERNITNLLSESAEFNARSRLEADFIEGISAFLEKRSPIWKEN